ncbi:MAG: ATP-binding protein, partial [Syntrophales bacterium]|nr:ATP-binding protein [Syntrophales bacterium]
ELAESTAVRAYLDNVLKAGERARHLVKQILSFSRQEKVVQQPISLTPIVKETLKFLRASLPTTIKIHTRLQAGDAIVVADPTQIHQTLLNLCTNAAHAMEEKGGTLEINLRELVISSQEKSLGYGSYANLPPGSYLELMVSDTGHGMEPAVMARIFDPFFTTKEPWKGTGMGLAVVYGIVKTLNGGIQVTSQPGQGATFRVLLPLAEGGPPEAIPEFLTPLSRGRGCILFVDDDEDFFPAGQRMLAELGYEVVSYNSSLKALEDFAAQPHRFDLIISDLTMPGLTGLELATACLHLRPDIPFILATGFSETVPPEKVRSTGVGEVVAKPFNLHQIGEIIKNVFKGESQNSRIKLEVAGR